MINDLDMQGWAYLLAPTFQFVNTAGKPLTEGYLEVYIAGTRNKYYCASDFDGTLHPFQIPLDSLGANIVLADPNQAYDVYVYNRFGSLIMSRYNVSPGNTGSGGVSMTTVTSQDNTINITHSGNNYDLSIKDTIDRIDNLEAQYGNLGASTDYAVSYGYGDGGEFVLTDKASTGINYLNDMSGWRLKPGHVYQLNYNAKFTCDEQTNKLVDGKFYLDGNMSFSQDWNFNLDDSYDYTESFNGSTIIVVPSTLQYYDLKLKYTFNSIVNCQVDLENISIVDITSTTNIGGGGGGYQAGDGININNNFISVDMDYINEHLDVDASSILSSAYNYTDVRVTQASGDIINIIAEATGSLPIPEQVQSDWEEDNTSSPAYIQHKPEVEEVNFEEINLDDYALASAIPDISNLATKDELNVASGNIINYVDNNIDNVTNIIESVSSEIPTLPEEEEVEFEEVDLSIYATQTSVTTLVSSVSSVLQNEINNIDLSSYATHNEVYEATVTAINEATSNYPDVSDMATQTWVNNQGFLKEIPDNYATDVEVYNATVTAINAATSSIPPQVQSDWAQTASGEPDYIKNKPEEESVEFEEINLSDYALASAVPSIEGLATVAQVSSVSSVLQNEIDNIPEQVNADWESNSGKSEILNKPDLSIYATHNEVVNAVSGASGNIINYVNEQIGEIPTQVQSDWTEDDSEDLAYIKNKPTERQLIPGDNISITASGNNFVISATGGEQVNANWNETDPSDPSYIENKPDLSVYATLDDVNAVTSLIPEAQVQSNWTEDNTTDPSYILNKPNELELVAGNNIEIAVSGTNIVISSTASAVTGIDLLYGKFTSNNVSTTATMAKSKGNINVSNGKIQLEQGKSYHITVRGYYQQTNAANSNSPISYVEYITSNPINIDIDRSRTDAQYFELSYDLFNLNSDIDYQVAFSGGAGLVKDLIVEVHSLGGAGTGSSGGGSAIEYDAGYGISIANQVISVDSSIIPDTSNLATKAEVANVSGTIVGQIPDVSSFATTTELTNACNNVISMIPEVPNLVAGNNITITESGNNLIISSTASGGGSGGTYTAGNGLNLVGNEFSIDTSVVATQSDLSDVEAEVVTATGDLQSQINNLPSQVQSNWTESDDSDPSYILNKPEEMNLVGGDNITITVSGSSAIINGQAGGTTYTAGDYIDITNNVISVDTSDVVDIVPGSNVTITVSGSSAIISSTGEPQVQSDWNVSDSSSKAYIKNKPTIPAAQVQSNWNETNTSSKAYIQNKPTIHTYTGASGINIANDVVSLDNPVGLVAGTNVTIEVSGSSAVINATAPTLASLNTAGITDVQVVQSLPASPVATVLYLIPEA